MLIDLAMVNVEFGLRGGLIVGEGYLTGLNDLSRYLFVINGVCARHLTKKHEIVPL